MRDYGEEIRQSVSYSWTGLTRRATFPSSRQRGPGKSNGALLMAVVGAKLSEGLNFADDLARAVVMVGLPYPNANSPELKERLKYVSSLSKQKGEPGDAGKELYENLCMNAVNQSIGARRSCHQAAAYLWHRKVAQSDTRETGQAWFWLTLGTRYPGSGTSYRAGFRPASRLLVLLGRL